MGVFEAQRGGGVSSLQELDILLRAQYPLLYVVSWEEERVARHLSELASQRRRKIVFWSSTKGICDENGACDPSGKAALEILPAIERYPQPALFVLKDFHAFLDDKTIVRQLRDIAGILKQDSKTVVVLSPTLKVPDELEKDFVVVDYQLPTYEELRDLLRGIAQAMRENRTVPVELDATSEERIAKAALGMTLTEAENAFAKAIVVDGKLALSNVEDIIKEFKQLVRRSRMLEFIEAQEDMGSVGGLDLMKDWFKTRGNAFTERAKEFGLPAPKGVLLLGVQGCGKSLSCKTISNLWKMPLLRLDMGAVFQGFVGSSEENMRRAIKTAETIAPCILWLDEIEKGLSGIGSSNVSDAGTTARVFSTFLTWLQEKKKPVFVAATANNIKMLPPELLRKGRFDDIFFIDLPTDEERKEIFSIHLTRAKRRTGDFDLTALAKQARGFSGAEIEQAVVSGLYYAFGANRDLETADLEQAIKETVPLSKTMAEDIQELREWCTVRARPASSAQKPYERTLKAL